MTRKCRLGAAGPLRVTALRWRRTVPPVGFGRPEPQEWRAVPPTWFSTRTNLVFVWRAAAYLFHGWSLQALLLGLRVTHAVLLGTAVMIGTPRSPHGAAALTDGVHSPLCGPCLRYRFSECTSRILIPRPPWLRPRRRWCRLFFLTARRNAWKSADSAGTGFAIAASGGRGACRSAAARGAGFRSGSLRRRQDPDSRPGFLGRSLARDTGTVRALGTIDVSGASFFLLPVGVAVGPGGDVRRRLSARQVPHGEALTNGGRFAALAARSP